MYSLCTVQDIPSGNVFNIVAQELKQQRPKSMLLPKWRDWVATDRLFSVIPAPVSLIRSSLSALPHYC